MSTALRRAGRRATSPDAAPGTGGHGHLREPRPRLRVATYRVCREPYRAPRPATGLARRSGRSDGCVRRMLDRSAGPASSASVYTARPLTAVVENRDHDALPAQQRLADLDLAVAPVETALQLEDPPSLGRASERDARTLAQPIVRRLQRGIGRLPGDEEGGHFRRERGGCGGKRLRSSAVILRMVSEPALTCFSSPAWPDALSPADRLEKTSIQP